MKVIHRGKDKRSNELLTSAQRRKVHELYRSGYELEHVAERFGLDEAAVVSIIRAAKPEKEEGWQVRWDDSYGETHIRKFKTFSAAKQCHAALRNVEWSRVERCG